MYREFTMTRETAIRKLRKVADTLITNHGDPNFVSRAFGYGKTDQDSRVQAGVICQMLANEIQQAMSDLQEQGLEDS